MTHHVYDAWLNIHVRGAVLPLCTPVVTDVKLNIQGVESWCGTDGHGHLPPQIYIQQNAVQRKSAQVGQLSEEHRQTLT